MRITVSQRLIGEINQLLEEKGISNKDVADNTMRQQINNLSSRLAELRVSE
jgi:hypothetical protein